MTQEYRLLWEMMEKKFLFRFVVHYIWVVHSNISVLSHVSCDETTYSFGAFIIIISYSVLLGMFIVLFCVNAIVCRYSGKLRRLLLMKLLLLSIILTYFDHVSWSRQWKWLISIVYVGCDFIFILVGGGGGCGKIKAKNEVLCNTVGKARFVRRAR